MARIKTPVEPEMVRWAIAESGYDVNERARLVDRSPEDIKAWMHGADQPTLPQLRRLAKQLSRPTALFYLAEPPRSASVATNLRKAPGLRDRRLSPREIKTIRWVSRIQKVLSWLRAEEFGDAALCSLPAVPSSMAPSEAADAFRDWLQVPVDEYTRRPRQRLQKWRDLLEGAGIAVFQFQIDRSAIRGFSIWDDNVPVLAVNTAYTPQARTFTLFHEVGHLLRRDGGACAGFADEVGIERWCEQLAAAFLLPAKATRQYAGEVFSRASAAEESYEQVRKIARHFATSVRATALRLIELGLAEKGLCRTVDRLARERFDDFPAVRPNGGGSGRSAAETRLNHFGSGTVRVLFESADKGWITDRDIGDFLHLAPTGVTDIKQLLAAGPTLS